MARAAKREAANGALQVIKGGAIPLSHHQRRLISMFIEYLHGLPEWDEKKGWEKGNPYRDYINPIIGAHFHAKYGTFNYVDQLPPDAEAEYRELLRNARTKPNPVLERRRKDAEMKKLRSCALLLITTYQTLRAECGLDPDPLPEIVNATRRGES